MRLPKSGRCLAGDSVVVGASAFQQNDTGVSIIQHPDQGRCMLAELTIVGGLFSEPIHMRGESMGLRY